MLALKFGRRIRVVARLVREVQQVELRLAQLVVDASAVNKKVGHAVSGLDLEARAACVVAERAAAIVDADLRDERKHAPPDRVELDEPARKGREDGRANHAKEPVRARRKLEHSVGSLKKPLRVLQTLFVVGLQKLPARVAFDDEGELPGEVVCVLY